MSLDWKSVRGRILALSLGTMLGGAVCAAPINIDIELNSSVSTPSSLFGAAAGQAGFWNSAAMPFTPSTFSMSLLDTSGAATGATFHVVSLLSFFNHNIGSGVAGDAGALLNDGITANVASQATSYRISGLAAGTYDVYTYAFHPFQSQWGLSRTDVNVNGTGVQNILTPAGGFSGGFALGSTHALHEVTLIAGQDLNISALYGNGGSSGMVNGFQIVAQTPAPASLALLFIGLAGIAASRRPRPR